jgi:hypothetical protein
MMQIRFAVAAVAGLIGLAVLPFAFGRLPDPGLSIWWLGLAVIACACTLVPARVLIHRLAGVLTLLPGQSGQQPALRRRTTLECAGLSVAAGYLVVLQAILRHPLVAVFGASAEPFIVEATFAVLALLLLLALLVWIYRAARPLVEGIARVALDAAFATSHSEEATDAPSRIQLAVTSTMSSAVDSDATIPSGAATTAAADEALTDSTHSRNS